MAIRELHFQGECLEALGIPSSGFAVIDPDAEPRMFDVVHCNDSAIAMCGYLKQIVRTGDKPIVQTAYKDRSRDFLFFAKEIYGVCLRVLDEDRNVVWVRPPDPVEFATIRHARWEYGSWKNGHWVKGNDRCRCSACQRDFASDHQNIWNGCPHCLARMDGGVIDG